MKRIKLAIILFYLVLFAGLALYDEQPTPELAREMARKLPETIEPGNAWMVFLGFSSPQGVSPYVYGEQKMKKLKTAVASSKNSMEFLTVNMEEGEAELQFQGEFPSFYGKKNEGMLPYAATHQNEIATFRQDNEELVMRYEALRDYPRYNEPLEYGYFAPIPRFSPLRYAQKIKLLELAVAANQADTAGALSGLREDMEFWRFIARSSSTLISKLIAIANLSSDLRFAAELGSSRQLNVSEMQMLQEILRPFAVDEATFSKALQGEARHGQHGMELTHRQTCKSRTPANFLFKPKATQNRMYSDYQEFIRLAELPPQKFTQEMKRQKAEGTEIRQIGLPFLYNPAGEFLASIGQSIPGIQNYIEKGHNLEGLRRLACLKVLAYRENIPPTRMQQFLAVHAQDFGNPYNDAPMTWDAKKASIFFTDISGEKTVEIFL